MKNATDYLPKLNGLLRRIKAEPLEPDPPDSPVVERLVRAFLQWETTTRQAEQAYDRLMRQVVDFNDLRVTDLDDLVAAVGPRYNRAEERMLRLKLVLQEIFEREHAVTLEHLRSLPKRDARAYLDGLRGMVPFVSASVVLLALGGHAIPVDEQLYNRMMRDGLVEPEATLEQVQAYLEHNILSADNFKAAARLRKYAEQGGGRPAAKTTKKTTKKTTRKTTKKSSAKAAKKTAVRTAKKTTKKKTTAKSAARPARKTSKKTTRKSRSS